MIRARVLLLAAVGLFAAVGAGRAQSPARAIEVASIRPAPFPSESYFQGWTAFAGDVCNVASRRPAASGSRVTLPKITLCQLIAMGYGLPGFQVRGAPAWMMKLDQTNYYDVQIKAEGDQALTDDQTRALLRELVANRFRVKLRHDTAEIPVYVLAPGKNGAKLQETPAGADPQHAGVPMTSYISFISRYVDRPIVDKTGLTGAHYAFHWDEKDLREELRSSGLMPVPSIFREVEQQLGLTLKPSKESMDVVVIDQVEKLSPDQLQEPQIKPLGHTGAGVCARAC